MLEEDANSPHLGGSRPSKAGMLPHIITAILVALALLLGYAFWRDWLSSVDRVVCTVFVMIGLAVALARSRWNSSETPGRWAVPVFFWSIAGLLILFALATSRPKLCGIALGFAVSGWCAFRIRGESVAHALSLGIAFMIPSLVDACKDRGAFEWAESIAIQITSGLADAMSQSNLRVEDTIVFGHGLADRFSCEGEWDSIVTFMGISFFCIYLFRRRLLNSLITLALAFVVWMAVRGAAWVTLSLIASQPQGSWIEWSVGLEILLFLIGAFLIVSLDQFFGALLEPIPDEFINPDFPLAALCWNWIVGLPNLSASVPVRDVQNDIVDEVEFE